MTQDTRVLVMSLGVGGLLLWYFSRQSQGYLPSTAAQVPTVLPSRQIGQGYIDAITGGTGIAPVHVDPGTGEISAPLGTDLILPAIDGSDPSLWATVPDLESGASSGWDFSALENSFIP